MKRAATGARTASSSSWACDRQPSGDKAAKLVDAAKESGNIRIMFTGRYRVAEYQGEDGTRLQHRVNADEIAVSLTGQTARVIKTTTPDPAEYGDDTPF